MMRRLIQISLLLLLAAPLAFAGGGGDTTGGHGDLGTHGKAHGHGGAHKVAHIDNWTKSFGCEDGKIVKYYGPGKDLANGPFLFALINFGLLIILLVKFAGKPISSYLGERHDKIKNDLEIAARLREEAEARLSDIQDKTKNLDGELADLKAAVRKDAELEKNRIIAAAQAEAKRIAENAERTLQQEVERVKRELEVEAIDAALSAANKLLKQEVTSGDRQRINDEYLEQIAATEGRN
jgi:F-type H+-transporting ATPase subunit b